MNTKDINLDEEPLRILLVGENGTGKTLAAGSFYKAGKTRLLDSDGRFKVLRIRFPEADINYDSFDSDNFRAFLDEIDSYQSFCPYKNVILDSVTSFSTSSVIYQLRMKDKMKTTKGGLPATSWDEINGETVLFSKVLEVMKQIARKHKTNIIWTAHPIPKTEIIGDTVNRTTSLASYGNKIPAIIPGYFDEIYNLQKERTALNAPYQHIVYTVPKNGLPGKTAYPKLLPESFNITDKDFYDVLMGFLNPKK